MSGEEIHELKLRLQKVELELTHLQDDFEAREAHIETRLDTIQKSVSDSKDAIEAVNKILSRIQWIAIGMALFYLLTKLGLEEFLKAIML